MTEQLKVQKDSVAEVVIDFGTYKTNIPECRIFANKSNEDEVVFIMQDVSDPNKKVQVTIRKSPDIQQIS